ncbi:hypothetical protein D478_27374 [Brevibacillus agri BAB-2500]|nr:hypothetical protein D478_27374 [Brevibacillus agri BAB-2500]
MKKYHVISDFIDKDTGLLIKSGDVFEADDERAEQLKEKQVIGKEVQEQQEDDPDLDGLKKLGGGYYELPNGEKVKGKENALEALKALSAATEGAGQQTAGEQ